MTETENENNSSQEEIEVDLEQLIGKVFDEKTKSLFENLPKGGVDEEKLGAFLDAKLAEVTKAFSGSSSSSISEDSILDKVGKMLDEKLSKLPVPTGGKSSSAHVGPLGRILS